MSCCCASGVTQTHAPVPSTRSGPLGAGSSYSGDMPPPRQVENSYILHLFQTVVVLWKQEIRHVDVKISLDPFFMVTKFVS